VEQVHPADGLPAQPQRQGAQRAIPSLVRGDALVQEPVKMRRTRSSITRLRPATGRSVSRRTCQACTRRDSCPQRGLGVPLSRSTLLRVLMALPIPPAPTPTVLSVDDVALRRGRRCATMLIDAVTHRRVSALAQKRWCRRVS
jgi:hypothetical protein